MSESAPPLKSLRHKRRHEQLKNTIEPSKCKADPGIFVPVVDPQKCEGKGDCAVVCPYDVFEIKRMSDEQFSAMPIPVKLKLWMHGRKTAYTPNADACKACGACVKACPEQAITLSRSNKPAATEISIEKGIIGSLGL